MARRRPDERTDLTAEQARCLFAYDPLTGELRWRVSRGKVRAGDLAGWPNGKGYLYVTVDGENYAVHRLAWLIVHGVWPQGEVDHEDRNRSNNRLKNLRDVPKSVNGHNTGLRAHNTSGFRGVTAHRTRWAASIQVNKRRLHLGTFDTKELAAAAYAAAAAAHQRAA